MEPKRSIITLGHWPQSTGKPEPIQWLVLEQQEQTALCLSRMSLDAQPYHRDGGSACWKDCSLRRWLNEEFLPAAFSPQE